MNLSSPDLSPSSSGSISPVEDVLDSGSGSPLILPPEICSPPPSPLALLPLSSSSEFRSLAWRLKHFDYLLPALRDLRQIFSVSDPEFRLIAPKVIKLFEITRDTLEKAGIELWTHSPCFVSLRPHKEAYFILLERLKARGNSFDASLRDRWLKLTCRLSNNFQIQTDPAYDLYLPPQPRKRQSLVSKPALVNTAGLSQQLCKSMPPPDVFPPSQGVSSQSLLGPRRPKRKPLDLWDLMQEAGQPSHLPCLRRPMTQRFGIFCTGKTSMLQPLGRGRNFTKSPRHSSS